MSRHRTHNHTQPLSRRPIRPSRGLPANDYGMLVGTLDHLTLAAHDGSRPDDNHIYLWIKVDEGDHVGKYEVAVNVHSSDRNLPPGDPRLDLGYHLHTENVDKGDWPEIGFFTDAKVSYYGMELRENDFTYVSASELRNLVMQYASTCKRIAAFGVTYRQGDGLHEVHMNSGNPPERSAEDRDKEDGMVIFYFDNNVAQNIFLKFSSQKFSRIR